MLFLNKAPLDFFKNGFCICDFETIVLFNKHYIFTITFYFNSRLYLFKFKKFLFGNLYLFFKSSLKLFNLFISFMTNLVYFEFVYFYNLSSFDGLLIVDYFLYLNYNLNTLSVILKDSKIYEIKFFTSAFKYVIFRDFFLLVSNSLSFVSKTFGGLTKFAFDFRIVNVFDLVTYYWPLKFFKLYCIKDVFITNFVVNYLQNFIFRNYCLDISNLRTISSLAFKLFRVFFLVSCIIELVVSCFKDSFIRKSYFGGIVEVYKPFGMDLFYYDINSLYPYAMLLPMPCNTGVWVASHFIDLTMFFGFLNVKISISESYFGDLPYKYNNVTLCPFGIFEGVYFYDELKYCITYKNCKLLTIFSGLAFQPKRVFVSFICFFYCTRLLAKLSFRKSYSYISKLILNSCYGRFALKDSISETFFDSIKTNSCEINELELIGSVSEKMINKKSVVFFKYNRQNSLNVKGSNFSLLFKNDNLIRLNNRFLKKILIALTAPQISSAITSYSRIIMNKMKALVLQKSVKSYYTDTDSLVVDVPLRLNFISDSLIGHLRLEHSNIIGYFLAPKFYYIFNFFLRKKINKGLTFSDLTKLKPSWFVLKLKKNYSTDSILYNRQVRKNVLSFSLTSFQIDYIYTFNLFFVKRLKIYNLNNIWIDTAQIKIIS